MKKNDCFLIAFADTIVSNYIHVKGYPRLFLDSIG